MHKDSDIIGYHYTGSADIRTILIVGNNLSGTSMLAGGLQLTGVYLGAATNFPFIRMAD